MTGERTAKVQLLDVLGRRMNPRYRFPGICAAARRLGCTRTHLYFVLSNERADRPDGYFRRGYERFRKTTEAAS
jgi:hypothetical protein